MSDEDRALAELQRRRASSEPAADAFELDEDHFTPVQPVIERVHGELCDRVVLTERERWLVRTILDLLVPTLWRHTANMEMRARMRSDSQDSAILGRRIDDVETSLVDIAGKSGGNGKLGALKERVDKAEARRWWAITTAASLAIAVIGSALVLYRWIGTVETDVEWLKQRRRPAISQPAEPAKDNGQ